MAPAPPDRDNVHSPQETHAAGAIEPRLQDAQPVGLPPAFGWQLLFAIVFAAFVSALALIRL